MRARALLASQHDAARGRAAAAAGRFARATARAVEEAEAVEAVRAASFASASRLLRRETADLEHEIDDPARLMHACA